MCFDVFFSVGHFLLFFILFLIFFLVRGQFIEVPYGVRWIYQGGVHVLAHVKIMRWR